MSYTQGPHGGELAKAAAKAGLKPENVLDFSSNTNIFAEGLTRALCAQTPYPFGHYPASDCAELRQALAAHEGAQPENIFCGNGAADLIWLALRVLNPSSVLFLGPAFSEYVRACKALGIKYQVITPSAREEFACTEHTLKRLWESRAELAIICSPNNPGGVTYENLANILAVLHTPRLLLDLSYRDFLYGSHEHAWHNWPALHQARKQGSEIITLHSFTKFFCCPGIRLGYLCGEARTLNLLAAQSPAWSVSPFALDLGLNFLDNIAEYRASLCELKLRRYDLGAALWRLDLFDQDLILEGPNFFCCGLKGAESETANSGSAGSSSLTSGRGPSMSGRAGKLQNALLRQGVLLRDCDNIPGMPPGFVRIQVRGETDNQRLTQALRRVSELDLNS